MKTLKIFLLGGVLFLNLIPTLTNAQCKAFIKESCTTKLKGHSSIFQGALDIPVLIEDGKVNVPIAFRGRKMYKIIVGSEKIIGDMRFKIINYRHQTIFDNKEHDMAQSWDFTFKTTQRVTIEITIAKFDMSSYDGVDARLSDEYKEMKKACAAIVVGMK